MCNISNINRSRVTKPSTLTGERSSRNSCWFFCSSKGMLHRCYVQLSHTAKIELLKWAVYWLAQLQGMSYRLLWLHACCCYDVMSTNETDALYIKLYFAIHYWAWNMSRQHPKVLMFQLIKYNEYKVDMALDVCNESRKVGNVPWHYRSL